MTATPAAKVAAGLGDPAAPSDTSRGCTPAGRGTGNAPDETPPAERGPDTPEEDTPGAPDQDTQGTALAGAPVPGALPVVFVQHVRLELLEPVPTPPRAYVPPRLPSPSRRWAGRR